MTIAMTVECTISRTEDSLAHAASLAGWQQEYDQLEPRAFRGQLVDIRTGSVRLFRECANCKTLQFMRLPSGYRHLVLPLSWPVGLPHDMSLQLLPLGQRYRVVVPGSFDVLGLSIPESMASKLPVHSREMICRPGTNRQELAALKAFLLQLTDAVSLDASKQSDAWITDQLETGALRLLELLDRDAEWQVSGIGQRQYIVERCQEIVQSRPAFPPSVAELCALIRVSRRTLQYSFDSQIGMTPTCYLRNIRLNAARRAIIAQPEVPVLDLASEQGFWHSSNFGRIYRDLFGELPSDTRRRTIAQLASSST